MIAGGNNQLLDLLGHLDHLAGDVDPQSLFFVELEHHLSSCLVRSVHQSFLVLGDLLALVSQVQIRRGASEQHG